MKKAEPGIVDMPDEFINRILSPEYVEELMDEFDQDVRDGLFHPAMTVWLMMFQRLSKKSSLSEAVQAFRAGVGGVLTHRCRGSISKASDNTSGYSQARTRLPEEAVNAMVEMLNEAMIGSHAECLWNGRHVYALDGTDFRVLAEEGVRKEFPPARAGKAMSPWSIIRSVVATHVVSGVALRPESGPMHGRKAVGEVGLGKKLLERFPESSIILADKGLGTYSIAFTAVNNGHDVLLRLTDVRACQALGGKKLKEDGELPCTWRPTEWIQTEHPEIPSESELPGRIIRHTFHQPGFKPVVLIFFTTLTLPIEQLVSLYALRWNIETDFRSMKTALKMELLDVHSGSMARKEIALGIAAYNMIRHLLVYAAQAANLLPRQISFTRYATRVRYIGIGFYHAAPEPKAHEELMQRLITNLHQIAHPKRRKKRPSRPRKVLRPPEPFPFWNTKSRKKERLRMVKLA